MDLSRPLWLVTSIGIFLAGAVAAYFFTGEAALVNYSSLLGLWTSIVGFAFTILTMIQTQHIARDAQEKVQDAAERSENAVKEAQRQSRAAMEKVATVILLTEVEQLLRHIHFAHVSGDAGRWDSALAGYQQALALIPYLAGNARLDAEGQASIQGANEALGKVVTYVRNRIKKTQRPDKPLDGGRGRDRLPCA